MRFKGDGWMISQFEENAKTFYDMTGLSISLYRGDSVILRFPREDKFERPLLPLSEFSHDGTMYLIPQYPVRQNNKCHILVKLNDTYTVISGSFMEKDSFNVERRRIAHDEDIPLKSRRKLLKQYDSVTVLPPDRYLAFGKLMRLLFANGPVNSDQREKREGQSYGGDAKQGEKVQKLYVQSSYAYRSQQYLHPPYFLERRLISYIKNADLLNARKTLAEINSLLRANLSKDFLRSLKNSLIGSCVLYTRAAIEGGVTPERAFTLSDAYINAIEEIALAKELNSLEFKMLESFVETVKEFSLMQYSNIVNRAIAYIHENIMEKIHVEDISRHIYVHPNYLSAIFKKETGTPLSEYITKCKIEEACHLIRYSNNTISDIALFYQFCNQSYFIKVFKKYMGITPQQYRDQQ